MKFWDGIQKLHILNLIILITGRMAAKRQLPVLKFTHRPKNQHFRPAWATRSTDSRQICHSQGAPGSTWPCSISSPVPGVGIYAPPRSWKFQLFGKESPHKRELLDRFSTVVRVFYMPNHPALVFYIWGDSLHGLRSAEKPHISHLPWIFRAS